MGESDPHIGVGKQLWYLPQGSHLDTHPGCTNEKLWLQPQAGSWSLR